MAWVPKELSSSFFRLSSKRELTSYLGYIIPREPYSFLHLIFQPKLLRNLRPGFSCYETSAGVYRSIFQPRRNKTKNVSKHLLVGKFTSRHSSLSWYTNKFKVIGKRGCKELRITIIPVHNIRTNAKKIRENLELIRK